MSAIAPLMFLGCATVGPPRAPSLDLPTPPSDLRASRKGDQVSLSWTIPAMTTDRENIRSLGPTQICRGLSELNDCGPSIGQVSTPVTAGTSSASTQKLRGSYTDTLPAKAESNSASEFATYAVQVLNRAGRSAGLSNRVRVPLARTLAPPRNFQAHVAKEGVVLSWNSESIPNASGDVQYVYRVYRHMEGSNDSVLAGETSAGQNEFRLVDGTIEWGKTYDYHADAVTLIRQANDAQLAIEGDDTPEVKIFADDTFPPAVPAELQAVFSGPGQKAFIDLVWAPVGDVDLAGYNVYRREEGLATVKLNSELVKVPAYRDAMVVPQKRYIYSVSAVDTRGNESAHSEETTESAP